jgi:hypothetical protein
MVKQWYGTEDLKQSPSVSNGFFTIQLLPKLKQAFISHQFKLFVPTDNGYA